MAAPIREPAPRRLPPRDRGLELRDLPLDGEGALYGQIYRALRDAILDGRVMAGTRLPTTRALAGELGVSRNTVVSAFEPLQAEGYVVSRVGAGTFVAPQVDSRHERAPRRRSDTNRPERVADTPAPVRLSRYARALEAARPRRPYDAMAERGALTFDFKPCVPDLERLPYDDWQRCLARTAHHVGPETFDYADPSGLPELREAIAHYLGRARGVLCRPEEIVVVGGVAQALDLVTRLFVDPGDAVLLEDPHYVGARRTFEVAGARIVGAPVDAEGLDLTRVAEADRRAARLAYVTPSHQYPTGVILSLARRLELLRWAEGANAFVLEDDYDSEFRYAGRAIPSLKSLDEGGRVLYVGTFSKTLLPALRIAYLVLPPSLVELFRSAKFLSDWAAPSFEQRGLARFLASGDFERHLRRARTLYARSRGALIEAVTTRLGAFGARCHDSHAGLHLLVRFEGVPATCTPALLRAAADRGLGLYPAAPSYLEPSPGGALELVMGFARLDPERIERGVEALAEALGVAVSEAGREPPPGRAVQ